MDNELPEHDDGSEPAGHGDVLTGAERTETADEETYADADLSKAFYVRTSAEFNARTVGINLNAREAVALARDLTEKQREKGRAGGYGVCVSIPGHLVFDDPDRQGGFELVTFPDGQIDTTIFDQKPGDPLYERIKNELSTALGHEKREEAVAVTKSAGDGRNGPENAAHTPDAVNKAQHETKEAAAQPHGLTDEDLKIAREFIPGRQYAMTLKLAADGEERDFYINTLRRVAETGRRLHANSGEKSYNRETRQHDKGFLHYFIKSSDFYICEVDEDGRAFGYTVLNGDTKMSEYGYTALSELTGLETGKFGQVELDFYPDETVSMERAICAKYPELKNRLLPQEKKREIETEAAPERPQEKNAARETAGADEITSDNFDPRTVDKNLRYKMLSTFQDTCKKYLENDRKAVSRLWRGNKLNHLTVMERIYNSFEPEERPEWLTRDELTKYETEMLRITYYVRTTDKFDPHTIKTGLSAGEAVDLAVRLTEEGRERGGNPSAKSGYSVCVRSPGHPLFDDPAQEGGIECVRPDTADPGRLVLSEEAFGRTPDDPVCAAAKAELRRALYEHTAEYEKQLGDIIAENAEKLNASAPSAADGSDIVVKEFTAEDQRQVSDYVDWLVKQRGCKADDVRPYVEKLYAKDKAGGFRSRREWFERGKALPTAFGDTHADAPWVTGDDLVNTIGIYDGSLHYHTVWDREWAARNGMPREQIAKLLEWDHSADVLDPRKKQEKQEDLFAGTEKKEAHHVFMKEEENTPAEKEKTAVAPQDRAPWVTAETWHEDDRRKYFETAEKLGFTTTDDDIAHAIGDVNEFYDGSAESENGMSRSEYLSKCLITDRIAERYKDFGEEIIEYDDRSRIAEEALGGKFRTLAELSARIEKAAESEYEPLYAKYTENRFQAQRGHGDGFAVSDRHWKIWDTVLNRSGANGAFFPDKKEAADNEARKMNDALKEEYEEALAATYRGYGAYTAHVFGGYLGSAGAVRMMAANFTEKPAMEIRQNGGELSASGVLESDAGSLAAAVSDWAAANGMPVPKNHRLTVSPTDRRKKLDKAIELSRYGAAALANEMSFVVQTDGGKAEYALAIDYAQRHGLKCYVMDNEITRILVYGRKDLDFVRLCKGMGHILTEVRETAVREWVEEEWTLKNMDGMTDKKDKYRMLRRLQEDCEYYLENGRRSTLRLQGFNELKHLAMMERIYNSLKQEERPEWLTRSKLTKYETEMLSDKDQRYRESLKVITGEQPDAAAAEKFRLYDADAAGTKRVFRDANRWRAVKDAHPDDVILFQVDDYFAIYEEDAERVAKQLQLAQMPMSLGNVPAVPRCVFPADALKDFTERIRDRYDVTVSAVNPDNGERIVYSLPSVDHEAERAIDAGEAEFGADGARVFRDNDPEPLTPPPADAGREAEPAAGGDGQEPDADGEKLFREPYSAASESADIQKKAAETAEKYTGLPLEDKINVIARTFGRASGEIVITPLSGKWRGTSDIDIKFDNGTTIWLGNSLTSKANTAELQNKCVNECLKKYNPELVAMKKEAAFTALKKREAADNAVALQKGLKPYTLLGVEFDNGSEEITGRYYVTLAVDGKIRAHADTRLSFDISDGKVGEENDSRPKTYYNAGGLKESDVDYVFHNVGFSSTSDMYTIPLYDDVRERAEKALEEMFRQQVSQQIKEIRKERETFRQQVSQQIDEFEKLLPGRMHYKEAGVVNGNEVYWVTQDIFTVKDLRDFQQMVRDYDGGSKKFYLTSRDLSPTCTFQDDMETKILAVVTPDTILKDDYVAAIQKEGLGDYLITEETAEQASAEVRAADSEPASETPAEEKEARIETAGRPEADSERRAADETPPEDRSVLAEDRRTRGQAARIRAEAREILANNTDDQIRRSREMTEILAQYEGGGGVSGEDGRTTAEVLNAFYTPRVVVDAVWKLADFYAPDARTVLEPSSGTGRFAEGHEDRQLTLRELDETSARIAKILHPGAEVIQGAFQAQFFDKEGVVRNKSYAMPKYDLVIGNPPYGKYTGEWKGKGEGREHSRIEEYFIEKGLDSLKDGNSALAFVVPSGWLRSGEDNIKELISAKGTLVDAYRLPNGAFDSTDVGTDIIVMKKKFYGERESREAQDSEQLKQLTGDNFFKAHPEKILGVEEIRSGRFGPEPYVKIHEGRTLEDELSVITENTKAAGEKRRENPANSAQEETPAQEKEPETTAETGTPRNRPPAKEKSYIETALERARNPGNDVSADEAVRKLLHISRDFTLDDFRRMNEHQWRATTRIEAYWRPHFDVDSRQVLITTTVRDPDPRLYEATRQTVLYATLFPDGRVKKAYDDKSDEWRAMTSTEKGSRGLITKAKLDRLNDIINHFQYKWQPVMDSFLGYKDETAYFASLQDHVLYPVIKGRYEDNRDRAFSSESHRVLQFTVPKNAVLVEKPVNSMVYNPDPNSDNSRIAFFFPRLQNLFRADGKVSIAALDEDDSAARLAGDRVEIPPEKHYGDFLRERGLHGYDDHVQKEYEKYTGTVNAAKERQWNTAVDEAARMSGLGSRDEYFKKAEMIIKNRTAERKAALEKAGREAALDEDQDILLDEIMRHLHGDFAGGDYPIFTAQGYSVGISQNKDNRDVVDIILDGKKALSIDEKNNTLLSHNNFRVTPKFIRGMRDRNGDWPSVADEKTEEETLSLDKILAKKRFSLNDTGKGETLAETAIRAMLEKAEFQYERDGEYFTVKRSGTVQKVFDEKSGHLNLIFEFDGKSDILKLHQESYELGVITAVEKKFREKYPGITVIKDITIDGSRYVDTDGITIIAPAKSQRYNPAKEHLMDNAAFADMYGKNWNASEHAFWAATDYKGYVDDTKLTEKEAEELRKNENYVLDRHFVSDETGNIVNNKYNYYIHKELYASGNIYKKIERLESLKKQGFVDEENYARNRRILTEALPKPIKLKDINVSVISPFVQNLRLNGEPVTERFIKWATGYDMENAANERSMISDFTEAGISREDIPPTIDWKDITDYIDGIALPVIRDGDLSDSDRSQVRNRKINDRKEAAEKLFTRYIQTSLTKEEEAAFADAYNRQFNCNRDPDYTKLPLFVDGMNLYRKGIKFKLYDQQIKGISFLCTKGNGLLAYDVGVGKTAAGIVATVQQIQSGRAKRPLIIVPKSVMGKWESDIHELFPDIPVNNLGNFSISDTGPFYNKANHGLNIPAGSITLVTKEALGNLHWDRETIDKYLFADYADLLSLNDKLTSDNPRVRAEACEKIYENANGKVRDDNYIEWKNSGFDHVTVDEAHAYKKLERKPRVKRNEKNKNASNEFDRIVGSGEPSQIARKMFNITQIIQRENENRNVFMLTATPFTNSPLEIYSMLIYVARKEMEDCGIKDLGDFCSQYAKTRYERVVKADKVDYATIMKEWGDLQGLQNILKQYIDKVDGEEAGIIRPEKKTHKVSLEATDLQKQIFEFAINEVMTHAPGRGEKGAPVLEGMNMMRTACLSPALLKPLVNPGTKKPAGIELPPIEQVVECSPKLKLVCDTVVKNWKAHHDCGQIIYMPEGTDAYPYVIDYMVRAGVPEKVFATIDGSAARIGGKNVKISKEDEIDDVRAKVADAFNDKTNPCKILIGSAAIGEGMDLNGNSIALYNTMMGWNPSECVQVEGRIWRQGNEQGHVHIVYPLIYDSIDSLLFQKHDEKGSRIDQLFSYKGKELNVADLDPEKLKYELIKNPRQRAKIKIDDEALAINNEILLLDNRLKDYDQLAESRTKFKKELAEKKAAKQQYIENHAQSVMKGRPNRSEEEQKSGLERFDKSISDLTRRLENISRKYAEMGIESQDDERNFASRLTEKKRAKKEEIQKLYESGHFDKVVEEVRKEIESEKTRELESALTKPLDEAIQSDMVPFHVVERRIKEERYHAAMERAKDDQFRQKELTEDFNEYLEKYEKKWGGRSEAGQTNVGETAGNKSGNPGADIRETAGNETPDVRTDDNENIVRIVSHMVEVYDREKNTAPGGQGFLFDIEEEKPEVTRALGSDRIDWTNSTCNNFAENMRNVFSESGQKMTKEAVLKAANKLISAMSAEEKAKFVTITRHMNITTKEKTDDFLTKIAEGQLELNTGKKPPVYRKSEKQQDMEINI